MRIIFRFCHICTGGLLRTVCSTGIPTYKHNKIENIASFLLSFECLREPISLCSDDPSVPKRYIRDCFQVSLIVKYLVCGKLLLPSLYRCGFCKAKARQYAIKENFPIEKPCPLLPKEESNSHQCCNNNCNQTERNGSGPSASNNTYV